MNLNYQDNIKMADNTQTTDVQPYQEGDFIKDGEGKNIKYRNKNNPRFKNK